MGKTPPTSVRNMTLCVMQSTASLSLLTGSLWSGVVVPDRVLSMGRIELNWIVRNRTVLCIKIDFALNNLEWMICHKAKPNQTKTSVWKTPRVIYLCLQRNRRGCCVRVFVFTVILSTNSVILPRQLTVAFYYYTQLRQEVSSWISHRY